MSRYYGGTIAGALIGGALGHWATKKEDRFRKSGIRNTAVMTALGAGAGWALRDQVKANRDKRLEKYDKEQKELQKSKLYKDAEEFCNSYLSTDAQKLIRILNTPDPKPNKYNWDFDDWGPRLSSYDWKNYDKIKLKDLIESDGKINDQSITHPENYPWIVIGSIHPQYGDIHYNLKTKKLSYDELQPMTKLEIKSRIISDLEHERDITIDIGTKEGNLDVINDINSYVDWAIKLIKSW